MVSIGIKFIMSFLYEYDTSHNNLDNSINNLKQI